MNDIDEIIRSITLKNAIEHQGKARIDSVISKLIGIKPEIRNDIKNIIGNVKTIVNDVNNLTIEEQRRQFEKLNKLYEEKKEEKGYILPPLPNVKDSVITRFPPEPNGYPHIGHAKAAIINEEYAKMYKGKLILRFDDTNPLKERIEYYDAILSGLNWLEVKPDLIKNTSDDMKMLYDYAKILIKNDGAYVCKCKQEEIKENRRLGIACKCRGRDIDRTMIEWDKMFNEYKENQAILRFKGDLSSDNTTMRDPTLFRIIDAEHPKQGKRYRVWPTYDFAAPIEDSIDNVTHAMRSKEYELRNDLYYAILDRLGLRKPLVIEFSRLEFDGMPVSKRMLKPLIEAKKVQGWDDPRLPTLLALKRRGILPSSIREFVLSLGFTKADTKPPFTKLEAINRKILDPISIRLFFVKDPIKMKIDDMPSMISIRLKNHPDKDLGYREIKLDNELYISSDDLCNLKIGDEIRLLELFNVKIDSIDGIIHAKYTGNELKQIPRIQWVSKGVEINVLVAKQLYLDNKFNENSLEVIKGYAEEYVDRLENGSRVQFVRFGFCILDEARKFILTHK
ncbi:MAG: glutamate--tRNA ligase [Candidatus Nitrosocaldaceae archaeon]